METTSTVNKQNSMRAQVAQSKGTEWMVSNYNAWQLRSPLPRIPERYDSLLMQLANRMSQKEKQLNSVLALSFRPLLLLLGLILSVKGR